MGVHIDNSQAVTIKKTITRKKKSYRRKNKHYLKNFIKTETKHFNSNSVLYKLSHL